MLFRIHVGTEYTKRGDRIDDLRANAVRRDVLNRCARLFGGATSFDTLGSYLNSAGEVVVERGFVVEVLADSRVNFVGTSLNSIALHIQDALEQESVLVTQVSAEVL
jgi:hypothetical protein